jgi:hypothetical protein
MKVLLDSNVWRYLVDHGDLHAVEATAIAAGVEIVVVPALVFEARLLQDDATRRKILAWLAHAAWTRLTPEAFLEAEEFKGIVRRRRPAWLIANPDLAEVNTLRADWQATDGGFWSRALHDVAPPLTDESVRGDREHELAIEESLDIRKRVHGRNETLPPVSLLQVDGRPPKDTPGWDESPVEYWRVPSLYRWRAELAIYASPYREWIDSEVDVGAIAAAPESLTELWFREIRTVEAPRQWLRGSFEFLQAFHKVTTGTPVDSQLSSHLIDVDVVVSADRNFLRFVQKCVDDAPIAVARPLLISGGASAVTELSHLLRTLGAGVQANP